MGGAPSRISYEERKVRLRNLDKENAGIQSKINEIIPIKNQLDQQVNSMKGELAQLNTDITQLGKDITTNIDTRTDLTGKKEGLEKDLESAEYLLKSVEQAIDEIKKYGNLQKRTQDFFDNEYEVLYTKIVARQLLKQDDYINRNATLMRSVDKFNQKYSNDYRNTEYQEKHTAYFVSLNSIFWWIYYILCLVILYQIVYIQNKMGLKTKVILGIVLILYPLSYRIYDLVLTKK
jgi:septal ring factor EnvC (AmiA/AmiB activator)